MDMVAVGGVRIAYERVGAGRPVVLAGGTGMPPVAWEFSGVRDALVEAGFEVVAYAARGVAPSDAPEPPYSIDDLTADLAGLLDHLGIRDAAVVGYSLGSFTAEALAHARPDLVGSLVLMAGAGPLSGVVQAVVETEAELIAALGHLPAAYSKLLTLISTLPPRVLLEDQDQVRVWLELLGGQESVWASAAGEAGQAAAAAGWLHDPDRMAALAGIAVPALVLAFEHDLYLPPQGGRIAADLLPAGRFRQIDGAAHGGLLTHPKETAEALVEFLTGV
ncbi:alpha/beta fold hydrolase [Yinghuangia soli]|uniref:Alpha/beta hydrolase n=1 Tax=Yinghuangia soli TaxID=2908204 RepID=A0AA41U7H9_9ACTN|nr:alpha/beta hydrolase [Yinghuangia soli]MCF2531974.1 alpha/beta hydrolase [Yinghuangia soli]